MTRGANSGGALSPVPTAVPPSASSARRGFTDSSRASAFLAAWAYPENSWPSRTGTASWRCVRPILITSSSSSALRPRASASRSSPGSSCSTMAR